MFALLVLLPIAGVLLSAQPLNALLLGPDYARNLGIGVRAVRTRLLLLTGLLTATVTALCGPISFIGLAVPHIARLLLRSADHRRLLPVCMLWGPTLPCCRSFCSICRVNAAPFRLPPSRPFWVSPWYSTFFFAAANRL